MLAYNLRDFSTAPALEETPVPQPGPGEVLIKIGACGLNFADLLASRGKYQDTPSLPFTMGMELAGTVVETGPGADRFAVGQRVAANTGQGGLAEYCATSQDRCTALPDAMSFEQGAAFQIAYGSSHLALAHRAQLQPGETVLVLGAAGGVGLTAVEIAKLMGARVIACARGAEKLEIARAAGADELVDSESEDLRGIFKSFGGLDVVYDAIGEPLFTPALRACAPEARYLVIGFAAGEVPQIPANILLVKNITVHGFYWGGYLKFAPDILTGSMDTLFGWFSEGKLEPHISHVLPLAQAAEGLELLRARKSTGKIVITP